MRYHTIIIFFGNLSINVTVGEKKKVNLKRKDKICCGTLLIKTKMSSETAEIIEWSIVAFIIVLFGLISWWLSIIFRNNDNCCGDG